MAEQTTLIHFASQVQPGVWKQLKAMALSGNIANGYIFTGPAGVGKEGAALSFAALLNCTASENKPCGQCPACRRFASLQHEHLYLVYPLPGLSGAAGDVSDPLERLSDADLDLLTQAIKEKARDPFHQIRLPRANRIIIQSIRHLRRKIYLKSAEPGYKVIILFAAHTLSAGSGESANALLKLLEEPPPETTLILVTDQREQLLPTILSRCQQVTFPPLSVAAIRGWLKTGEEPVLNLAAFFSGGDMNAARLLARQSEQEISDRILAAARSFSAGNAPDRWQVMNELSALARSDPEAFRYRLTEVQFWFSLLQKKSAGLALPAFCAPFQAALEAMENRYPAANIPHIILTLEELKRAPQQNLHLDLALAAASIRIQRFLSGANRHSLSREIAP